MKANATGAYLQFDVVPPDNVSISSLGRKTMVGEPVKKKNPAAVKISPWTLARMNSEDVSKAAAEARKKSKILQPVVRQQTSHTPEANSSFGSSGRQIALRPDNNKRRPSKRVRQPAELPFENLTEVLNETAQRSRGLMITETSRSAFHPSQANSSSRGIIVSSPESSLNSPDIHPLRVSSSGAEDARHITGLSTSGFTLQKEILLSSSTSDGYDASGGEDSDRVPTRFMQKSAQWSDPKERDNRLMVPYSSSSQANNRRL